MALSKKDFDLLSDFRYELNRFLRRSEQAIDRAGLTAQQAMLLLHLKAGYGTYPASVAAIADKLQLARKLTERLVKGCEACGLVGAVGADRDMPTGCVYLTRKGAATVEALAAIELELLRPSSIEQRLAALREREARDAPAGETAT
jgi:DNA-binding MarR family transcriptional regulator